MKLLHIFALEKFSLMMQKCYRSLRNDSLHKVTQETKSTQDGVDEADQEFIK
jgi:hypothetical protein